ncbi:MAG: tRNA pseudouridine(38-40) synthase TruA [Acholeplasmataceae bacterium]
MKYLGIVSYDGTDYHGFQRQKNALGIQEIIERAFRLMTQTEIRIHGASRTDKGVHALRMPFHFETDLDLDPEIWVRALNQRLPHDIRIMRIKPVHARFHARHSAKGKVYRYVIAKKPSSVFNSRYEAYVPDFDIEAVRELLPRFEGTHDFKGFCRYTKGKETVRTINSLTLKETKKAYVFTFDGVSFLRYMVRSIMGTLIEIGQHRIEPEVIDDIFETKDRELAGKTAEARGLFLVRVKY